MNNDRPGTSNSHIHHGNSSAASAFHLSETLDWSNISAQMKNRVLVVPDPRLCRESKVLGSPKGPSDSKDSSSSNGSKIA